MGAGDRASPEVNAWIAAVHATERDRRPVGSGIVLDERRVITCFHVIRDLGEPWIAFPNAQGNGSFTRRRVKHVVLPDGCGDARDLDDGDLDVRDLAILELAESVPAGVIPAPLCLDEPGNLVGKQWWAFGFPNDDPLGRLGSTASGRIGDALGYGWVRLHRASPDPVEFGFSGGGVWCPHYRAVAAIVSHANGEPGGGRAITLHQADKWFPSQNLRGLVAPVGERRDNADAAPSWQGIPGSRGTATRNVLGERGQKALRKALAGLAVGEGWARGPWAAEELRRLEGFLAGQEDSFARTWALRTVGDALIALETVKLLKSRRDLNSGLLRRALAALRASGSLLTPALPPCGTEAEAVETVAFDYPSDEADCRQQMARFVMLLLAPGTGQVTEATGDPDEKRAFHSWAESDSIGWVPVNGAAEFARTLRRGQHLRLIIGLHASLAGDWPDSLEAWLRLDGEPYAHESFSLSTMNKSGAEKALGAALSWAHRLVRDELDDLELRRVDIAAPTVLLLSWRPEEADVGRGSLLGVRHEVVAHWSERLNPTDGRRWILEEASWRLAQIDGRRSGAPIDWLTEEHTRDPDHLSGLLQEGRFIRAIGLEHNPGPQIMDLLFSYIPIVLWPATAAGFPLSLRSQVDGWWESLPTEFLVTHRAVEKSGRRPEELAAVRAVWDDSDWLKFCGRCSDHVYP